MGMSLRQRQLTQLWERYTGEAYKRRLYDWNGDIIGHGHPQYTPQWADYNNPGAGLAAQPNVHGGGATKVPLAQRKPAVRSRLAMAIVNRFTQALFSAANAPAIQIKASTSRGLTEARAAAITSALAKLPLFTELIQTRTYGGAMGSAITKFDFVDGNVRFIALDPRWCTPTFRDMVSRELQKVEIRYMVQQDYVVQSGPDIGTLRTGNFWYREVIDTEKYTVYQLAMVDPAGKEPQWAVDTALSKRHDFGFVPVRWSHNMANGLAFDGLPDCEIEDELTTSDYLLSQAARGAIANCEPILAIATEDKLSDVTTGSGSSLDLGPNGRAELLEMEGTGPNTAMSLAKSIRNGILEDHQCVLNELSTGDRATAQEVFASVDAMTDRVDTLRGYYAQKHVQPLVRAVLNAAGKLHGARVRDLSGGVVLAEDGRECVHHIHFVDELGARAAQALTAIVDHDIHLVWPPFREPTMDDSSKAVATATAARDKGLITQDHAVRFVANYLHISDPARMSQLAQAESEKRAEQAREQAAEAAEEAAEAKAEGEAEAAAGEDEAEDETEDETKSSNEDEGED